MREDPLIRLLREAIRDYAKVPPEERLQALVRRGIIDEKGRVLVRMPEPPKTKRLRKKPEADSPAPVESPVNGGGLNGQACFMSEDMLLQRMAQAIRDYAKVPPEERFQALVNRGIIDEKGRVLVRMPERPKMKKTRKKPKGGS
jgi:hypothetical protein